ncbi:hypothetical protein D9M68_917270 [compost metagenome]
MVPVSTSALAGSVTRSKRNSRPASGRSISRDQWISAPKGALSRCCTRSYQPCPLRKSRTTTMRMASSVSRNRGAPALAKWLRHTSVAAARSHTATSQSQSLRRSEWAGKSDTVGAILGIGQPRP